MVLPVFLVPVFVGLTAQFMKRFLNKRWLSTVEMQGIKLPRYGGMPSAHTAFAVSLLTIVGLVDGLATTSFAITIAFTIFILDDALRMRIFLGRHGLALRKLIKSLPPTERGAYPELETRLGHRPQEVAAGALYGFIATVILYFLFL